MCKYSPWSWGQVVPQSSVQSGIQKHKFKAWSWNLSTSGACAKWACIFMRLLQFVLRRWLGERAQPRRDAAPRVNICLAEHWTAGALGGFRGFSAETLILIRSLHTVQSQRVNARTLRSFLLARSEAWYGCDCTSPRWTIIKPGEVKFCLIHSCFGFWS